MGSDDEQEAARELRTAAVMFPKLFLWAMGMLILALTGLGGVVVTGLVRAGEEAKQKVETHDKGMTDHEARLRLLEQQSKDIKDTAKETRDDVKEIRRLIEGRGARTERSERP